MLQSVSGLIGDSPEKNAKSLLEMLLQAQLLTEEQAKHVRQIQGRNGSNGVIEILLSENLVAPEQLALVASLHLGTAFVNLKKQEADDKAVEILPEWVCRKYHVIPFKLDSLVKTRFEEVPVI